MDNLVFSNMLHRPARTLTSVLGIAVGVMLIAFTVGLANGTLRERAQREANIGAEIIVYPAGTKGLGGADSLRLPVSRVMEIEQLEGIKNAVPLAQNTVPADDNNSGSRLVDAVVFDEYAQTAGLNVVRGRAFNVEGDEVMIDSAWATTKKLGVGSTIKMYERDFTVVGIYEPVAGARLKIPLTTMQRQLTEDTQNCTSILVSANDPNEAETVARRISERFPTDQVLLTKELEDLYVNSIPALNVFLNVVIGVASVISALVILLTMYTTVTERTRQIGVLKALGMSKTGIAWTITQEALLISFLGVIGGVLLTVLLRAIVMRTTTMQVQLEWQLLLITLFVGLAGGALGALYPAIRAARLDPVEALSYE